MIQETGEIVVTKFREVFRRRKLDGLGSCAFCRTKCGWAVVGEGSQGTGCGMWCLVRPDSLFHSCVRSGRPKPQALSVGGSGCSKKMGLFCSENGFMSLGR